MTSQAPSIASAGASLARWRATLVDAGPALADLFERLHRADDPPLPVNRQPDVTPARWLRRSPSALGSRPMASAASPVAQADSTLPSPLSTTCSPNRSQDGAVLAFRKARRQTSPSAAKMYTAPEPRESKDRRGITVLLTRVAGRSDRQRIPIAAKRRVGLRA